MLRYCFPIAFLFTFQVNGQDTAAVITYSKWSLGGNVSPDMAYRTLKLTISDQIGEFIVDSRNDIEKPRLGYTAGLAISYSFNSRWAIGSGVSYSLQGYQVDLSDLTYGDQIDERRGFVYNSDPALRNLKFLRYDHQYIGIPLFTSVTFGERRLKWISSSGVTGSYLIGASSRVIYSEGRPIAHSTTEMYNRFNVFATISSGASYALTDRSEIRVEPTFRYGLLRIIDTSITGYLWSGGVNFGWWLRL